MSRQHRLNKQNSKVQPTGSESRQVRTFLNFRSNTLIHGAELLGRKRGIFVLAAYAIEDEHSAMNTLLRDRFTEERIMMNLQLLASGRHSGLSRPPQGRASRPQGRFDQRRQRFFANP